MGARGPTVSLVVATALAVACGGKAASDSTSSTAGASQGSPADSPRTPSNNPADAGDASPACSSSLPAYNPDGATGRGTGCSAARAYLQCELPDSLTLYSMSNDPDELTFHPRSDVISCHDLCDPVTELAVFCGGDTPPSGCRQLRAYPAPKAASFHCCPCGS